MKNTVLKYGLIIGSFLGLFLLISMQFFSLESDYDIGQIIGYSSMIIAFSFMFIGIRSYRDNESNGNLSFARALSIGLLIALISSVIYSLTWTIYSEVSNKDFMEIFSEMQKKEWIEDGLSEAEIEGKIAEYASWTELYKNPFFKFLITIIEPLPVGIIMSFFLALILKRKVPEVENGM